MADTTSTFASLPADDLSRGATLVDPDGPGLTHLAIGPGTYTILFSGSQTGGAYALIDMLVPPNSGPPPHRHDFEEMFHVLEGELEVTFRGETMRLKAGHSLNIPANAPHGFRVASATAARFLCLCVGPGQEEYFETVGDPLPSRTAPAPALSPEEVTAKRALALSLAARFHSEFLPPPH
ncbi:cupin domain-containing protein [Rubellimicrobium roseum]|uniref:Cupin domain-containing protein n=1 Tax=Rubellimicrobium roseum TaxID=687525 RepID=A0A5C4N5M5_9RHOB|nr:cupin domain-containing protein [Rubellimicrobium roseum]TNC64913.1 cupin domain-containing protein [Rubellimicrobium roseum]